MGWEWRYFAPQTSHTHCDLADQLSGCREDVYCLHKFFLWSTGRSVVHRKPVLFCPLRQRTRQAMFDPTLIAAARSRYFPASATAGLKLRDGDGALEVKTRRRTAEMPTGRGLAEYRLRSISWAGVVKVYAGVLYSCDLVLKV